MSGSAHSPSKPDGSAPAPTGAGRRVWLPLAAGGLTALAIYIVASSITPDPTTGLFGTTGVGTFPLKSDLSSGVLALAAFQVYTALWLFGKINRRHPPSRRLRMLHRGSGVAALVLSLPIAYNCLFAYGFEHYDRRVAVHALAGCFLYGAFVAKIVVVRSKRLPGWALPVAGGVLVTTVVVLWYSAALWYYNGYDSPGLSPAAPSTSYSYRSAAPARRPAMAIVTPSRAHRS